MGFVRMSQNRDYFPHMQLFLLRAVLCVKYKLNFECYIAPSTILRPTTTTEMSFFFEENYGIILIFTLYSHGPLSQAV
jgi:hypothetical protein